MVRGTSLADVNLRPWMGVSKVLVNVNVGLRRLLDRVPGATARAAARESDLALWGSMLAVARVVAARKGIHGTPYDHHNETAAAGCPVPHQAAAS
jgi:hypothetical protein